MIRPTFGALSQLPLSGPQKAQLQHAVGGSAPAGEGQLVTPFGLPRILRRLEIGRSLLECAAAPLRWVYRVYPIPWFCRHAC